MRALVVALVAAFALPLVASGSALATTGITLGGQFGGFGSGDGQFIFAPQGLAVMQSSGEVFASDPYSSAGARVQRFDASGTFVSAISLPLGYSQPGALATDSRGGGSVYVSLYASAYNMGAVAKFSAAGTLAYALNIPSGVVIPAGADVAVDPVNGTVFVAATSGGVPVVATFDGDTGAFLSSFDGSSGSPDGAFSCVNGLAIDEAHRLYVLDGCTKNRVYRYSADGTFAATVDDGSRGTPSFVAVDPVSGEVFVAELSSGGTVITPFGVGGVSAGVSFAQGSVGSMGGLAVGHDSATVYAADVFQGAVLRFVQFEGPTVVTTTSAPVDASSQTLNGTIDPEGGPATYRFEYGPTTAYGSQTAESDPLTGTDPLPASAAATGLTPNTTYHFRIVGSNALGSIFGEDQTFTTAAAPPVLDGSPAFASELTPTGAKLNATLNPSGSATTYHFEYGTTTSYGSSSTSAVSSAGVVDEAASVLVTGLTGGATYHYRLVADNGTGGVQYGADGVFHTAPATPVTATGVTVFGATLHGVVNPHGVATTYHFEYGTSTAYEQSTPEADAGFGDGEQAVSEPTAVLIPGTTYHFRLVATSNGLTTSSEDRTFTTGALPVPVAKDATGISLNAATVNGTVDTHGKDGTYHFSVEALDRTYVKETDPQTISSTEAKPVSVTLTDVPAGTQFRVKLTVTSNGVAKTSDQVVFATPAQQIPLPRPPVADQGSSPYGCTAPVLNAYDAKPKPGETITITGKDLGSGGTIALGDTTIIRSWSSTELAIQVPEDATGTLALTVNCGQVSNTIAVAVYEEPSNAFSIAKTSVKGSTATLSLKLPGVGKVQTSGKHTKNTTTTVTNAGTVKVKVKLSSAGSKALKKAKGRKLNVPVRVRYTPAGGVTASETVTVTYTRKAGR